MGIGNFFRRIVKNNTNVRGWMDWQSIRQNAKVVTSLVTDTADAEKSKKQTAKSFEDAVRQYGLTENDIQVRMTGYRRIALFCALLGTIGFGWAIYLLFKGLFLSSLVSLSLGFLMFTYGFREHFHYFQMKKRRLDCTFKEWLHSLFSRK